MTGISLVTDEEKNEYKMGRAKIFYRRIPSPKRNAVIKKLTRKGVTDWSAVAAELLEWAILGWDGVDDKGAIIKFDPALIPRLPEDVRGDLMGLTGAASPEDGATGEHGSENS